MVFFLVVKLPVFALDPRFSFEIFSGVICEIF